MKSNQYDDNDIANLEFALVIVKQKLDFQSKVTQALDTKTGILLGFVSVVAANILLLINDKPSSIGLNLFTLGLLVLSYSFWCLIKSARTKDYLDPPDFGTFYSEAALAMNNVDLKNQVIADMKKSYEHNHDNDKDRAAYFEKSIWALAASVTLLVIGVVA
jgi:hypothetical protein